MCRTIGLIILAGFMLCLSNSVAAFSNPVAALGLNFRYSAAPTSVPHTSTTITAKSEEPVPTVFQPEPIPYFGGYKQLKFSDHCFIRIQHNERHPELSIMHFPNIYKVANAKLPPYFDIDNNPEIRSLRATGNCTALRLRLEILSSEQHVKDQGYLRRTLEDSRNYLSSIWLPENIQEGCRAELAPIWTLYEHAFGIVSDERVIEAEAARGSTVPFIKMPPLSDLQPEKLLIPSHQALVDELANSEIYRNAAPILERIQAKFGWNATTDSRCM